MKIRKLMVRHFRGIKQCDWHIPSDLLCLVGPGDSTKTTLLDAMGLVLSRNYAVYFSDADFFGCDTTTPVSISVAITNLPDYLLQEDEFGHFLSGISSSGELYSEPLPGSESCMVIRLTVFADLEPVWEVIRVGVDDTKRITANQRQRLAFFRLGEYFETHLRWSRNSALSAMSERESPRSTIVEAHRTARASIFRDAPKSLVDVSKKVTSAAQALGTHFSAKLQPGLDPSTTSTGNSLVLHDQEVPVQNFGRGTQRLTSLSIQLHAASGGSIVAIDEVEFGLEPHRLVHLLRSLKTTLAETNGQIFLTTHSPVSIQSLTVTDLWIVRSREGITRVTPIPTPAEDMQGTLRASPQTLLARKIIVGEGATEEGFLRRLIEHWDSERAKTGKTNSGTLGAVVSNGSGRTVVQRSLHLARLGYDVALAIDHDDTGIQREVNEAEEAGVTLFQCSEGCCFEEDFVLSLNPPALERFVDVVLETMDEESVISRVGSHLSQRFQSLIPSDWYASGLSYEEIRTAFAKSAAGRKSSGKKEKGWFKTHEGGTSLADFFIDNYRQFNPTHFVEQIADIEDWIYDGCSYSGTDSTHE